MEKLLPVSYKNDSIVSFRDLSFSAQDSWSKIYQNSEIDEEFGEQFIRLDKGSFWFPSTTMEYIKPNSYALEFEFKAQELHPNSKVIVSVSADDKVVYYGYLPMSYFMKSQGTTWTKAVIEMPKSALDEFSNEKLQIQLMLYKESGHELLIKNPVVREYPNNKYTYSFFEKIMD